MLGDCTNHWATEHMGAGGRRSCHPHLLLFASNEIVVKNAPNLNKTLLNPKLFFHFCFTKKNETLFWVNPKGVFLLCFVQPVNWKSRFFAQLQSYGVTARSQPPPGLSFHHVFFGHTVLIQMPLKSVGCCILISEDFGSNSLILPLLKSVPLLPLTSMCPESGPD